MINGRILGRSFYTTSSSSATLGKTLSLIGVNLNLGQPKVGVEYASQILRKNGVEQLITDCNWCALLSLSDTMLSTKSFSFQNLFNRRLNSIPDYSQQPFQGTQEVDDSEGVWKAKNHALISQNLQNLNELLDNEMSKNIENFMLFIGGDHSISMGTIPSMVKHRGRTGIVWVDAHADINTPESSPSGNMHGMSLAFLSGIATLPSFHWLKPCIDVSDIVYIGLRDLDDAEKKVIKDLGIKTFTMREIDKLGIGEVMSQCNHVSSCYHLVHYKSVF